ncbi:MAG: two-component system, LytTR family, sensor histidine kinase AlgZ [Acidobacteriota bacterium]|jgi:LytS/YehU family sensor histidine kinase|nr:two-component system, LytTR family, sensor histidine kinase AlgZ [Acidobacteriota bacterium]
MTWWERILLAVAIGGGALMVRVGSAVLLRFVYDVPDQGVILGASFVWVTIGAGVPFMAQFAERYPAACRPIWRNVVRHAGFAIALSVTMTLLVQAGGALFLPYTLSMFVRYFVWMVGLNLPAHGFIYLTVLGVVWAVTNYRALVIEGAERIRIEQEIAAATAAALERRLQPALIIGVLDRIVALSVTHGVAAERLLLRLARHVRLLLRTSGEEQPSLTDELRVASSAASLYGNGCSLTFHLTGHPLPAPHVVSAIVAALDGETGVAIAIDADEQHLRIDAPEPYLRKLEEGWGVARQVVLTPEPPPGAMHDAPRDPSRTLDRLLLLGVPLYQLAAFAAEMHIQGPLRMGDPPIGAEARSTTFLLWIVVAPLLAFLVTRMARLRLRWAMPALAFAAVAGAASIVLIALVVHGQSLAARNTLTVLLPMLLLRNVILSGGLCALTFSIAYTRQLARARLRNARLANAVTIAEAQTLESKLHPHFLFNALNSIVALLRERPDAAREMTMRLAHFLRLAVRTAGRQEWSLDEERRAIEDYLFIEHLRHGDRLQTRWRVGARAQHALLPRLLLQPLVENAVKHGVSRLTAGGWVVVSIARRRQRLVVRVENDITASGSPRVQFGRGLDYVTARLLSLYGAEGRLQVARDGARFVVSCRFPYQTAKEVV